MNKVVNKKKIMKVKCNIQENLPLSKNCAILILYIYTLNINVADNIANSKSELQLCLAKEQTQTKSMHLEDPTHLVINKLN